MFPVLSHIVAAAVSALATGVGIVALIRSLSVGLRLDERLMMLATVVVMHTCHRWLLGQISPENSAVTAVIVVGHGTAFVLGLAFAAHTVRRQRRRTTQDRVPSLFPVE